MTFTLPSTFTHSHSFTDDGRFSFGCATDALRWPWLALPPFDPIVVQTLNYYAAYEEAIARGHYDAGQWTALTKTEWSCGDPGVGHAVRGESMKLEDGAAGYRMNFFDGNDALVYRMSGEGVVFRDRDFESWRREQKRELDTEADSSAFTYQPAEAVGVATQVESFLSALVPGAVPSAGALVTMENGFLPDHPYHSGSGDHVNATHLADAARQFLCLLHGIGGVGGVVVTGGSMQFRRYVELGCPFLIELRAHAPSESSATLAIRQAGRDCATLSLRYRV